MSAFSPTFWYKRGSLSPVSGKVELPLMENEPLGKSPGLTEKCELRIEGMTCGACVEVRAFPTPIFFFWLTEPQSIEGMLRSQPGIHSVKVALLAERGVVEFDPQQWDAEKVINVRVITPIIAFDY